MRFKPNNIICCCDVTVILYFNIITITLVCARFVIINHCIMRIVFSVRILAPPEKKNNVFTNSRIFFPTRPEIVDPSSSFCAPFHFSYLFLFLPHGTIYPGRRLFGVFCGKCNLLLSSLLKPTFPRGGESLLYEPTAAASEEWGHEIAEARK